MTSSRSAILALLLIFIMQRNLYKKKSEHIVKALIGQLNHQEYAMILDRSQTAVLVETLPIKHKFWIRTSSFNESYHPIKQIKL